MTGAAQREVGQAVASAHQAVSVRSFDEWMQKGSGGRRQRYRKSSRGRGGDGADGGEGGDGGCGGGGEAGGGNSVGLSSFGSSQARRELVPPRHLRHKVCVRRGGTADFTESQCAGCACANCFLPPDSLALESPADHALRSTPPSTPSLLLRKARADFFGRAIGVAVPAAILGTIVLSVLISPDASR